MDAVSVQTSLVVQLLDYLQLVCLCDLEELTFWDLTSWQVGVVLYTAVMRLAYIWIFHSQLSYGVGCGVLWYSVCIQRDVGRCFIGVCNTKKIIVYLHSYENTRGLSPIEVDTYPLK